MTCPESPNKSGHVNGEKAGTATQVDDRRPGLDVRPHDSAWILDESTERIIQHKSDGVGAHAVILFGMRACVWFCLHDDTSDSSNRHTK